LLKSINRLRLEGTADVSKTIHHPPSRENVWDFSFIFVGIAIIHGLHYSMWLKFNLRMKAVMNPIPDNRLLLISVLRIPITLE